MYVFNKTFLIPSKINTYFKNKWLRKIHPFTCLLDSDENFSLKDYNTIPSVANFITIVFDKEKTAKEFLSDMLKNGVILRRKENLWKIIEFQHVKPGKGAAFVRTKLKNIKTGQVVDETFRAGEKVEIVRVETHSYNFSYNDANDYYFMHNETFDQISLE